MPVRRPPAFALAILGILLLAGTWRTVMAIRLPVLARDGVTFCWFARDLGDRGWAFLRDPSAQQHPLFPALILGVQRSLLLLGAPDTPLTWQRSGQVLTGLAGLAVVALAGALTYRLARLLVLPGDARRAALLAMLLATVLDVHVWVSADVMSDGVHLAFYLGAVLLLTDLGSWRAALACGLLSGLAFLTREEGFVPAFAGVLALLLLARRAPALAPARLRLSARALAILIGFFICALPYWLAIGKFSAKKNLADASTGGGGIAALAPDDWSCATGRVLLADSLGFTANLALQIPDPGLHPGGLRLAKLRELDLRWYSLLPYVLYMLFRAGRVVVPLLALPAVLGVRGRLRDPPLVGVTICFVVHLGLTVLVLARYGYLDSRHLLVPVLLLLPLAALQLSRLAQLLLDLRRRTAAIVLVATFEAIPAAYAFRVPNSKDAYLSRAAAWLAAHDPALAGKRLVCAETGRRIAFYTGMQPQRWSEDPTRTELPQLLTAGPVGYFALELENPAAQKPQFETAGNRALLARLLADPPIAASLRLVHSEPAPGGAELQLFALHPAPAPATSSNETQSPPEAPQVR